MLDLVRVWLLTNGIARTSSRANDQINGYDERHDLRVGRDPICMSGVETKGLWENRPLGQNRLASDPLSTTSGI